MARKKTKPGNPTPFSDKLSLLRRSHHLSMTRLSEQIDVTPSYISLLEAGERHPSREIVIKIGHVFFTQEDQNALDELLLLAGLSPMQANQNNPIKDTLDYYEKRFIKQPKDFSLYAEMIRTLIRNQWSENAETKIYAGMKLFCEPHQLQTLTASLQLNLGNFAAAAASQDPTMQMARTKASGIAMSRAEQASIYANAGLIFHLWGKHEFDASGQFETRKQSQEQADLQESSKQHLSQACLYYQRAIDIHPEISYLHYEFAQTLEKISDLSDSEEKKQFLHKGLDCLSQLISSELFHELEPNLIRDASLDLAYVHSKSRDFLEGRKLLGLLQAAYPGYWRVYYIKACHYIYLADQKTNQDAEESYDQAIKALEKSLSFTQHQSKIIASIQINQEFKRFSSKHREQLKQVLSP